MFGVIFDVVLLGELFLKMDDWWDEIEDSVDIFDGLVRDDGFIDYFEWMDDVFYVFDFIDGLFSIDDFIGGVFDVEYLVVGIL